MLVLALIISGCSSNSVKIEKRADVETSAAPQEQVTVNWLARWKNEHLREDFVVESAKEFEVTNPGIKVNYKFFQDAGMNSDPDIAKKIVEMINTGNYEWDVVIANTGTYGDVAEMLNDPCWGKKYLVDFKEVPGFVETQKDFIMTDYLDEYCGALVGPYIEGFFIMVWYNKELADKIEIDIKQHGMTWDDFVGYVKALDEYNKAHGTNIAALYESNPDWRVNEYMFAHLFKSAVGDLDRVKDEKLTDEKKAALLKTFKAMEELSQYKPLLPGHDTRAWYDTRSMSFDGTVLFTVNGAWMYNHWMDIDETLTYNMMPAELPVFQPVDFYMGSFIPQYAVMKGSPHEEEAIKLLQFLSRPQTAEKWVRYTKAPTGIIGHLSTSDIGDDQFEQFQAEVNNRFNGGYHFSDNAGYMLGEENILLDSKVDELMIDVLDGEITGQEAYDRIMAEIK